MELSNAVTVLIARMESHPEDFELYGKHRAKFAGTAESLYGLCGMDKERADAFWFLNDADKQALIDAWKQFHCKQHEKEVLNAIFDESYYERQKEQEAQMQMYQAQQRAMIQNQMMQSTGTYQTTITKPGQIHPLHNNAAQNNTGLLGSAANAFSGIFK
jgi:lysine/ornithine N-monooxygenase